MKQIATFNKPEEAEMLRAFLAGSGIQSFVRDAHTVSADWMLSNAIGGVKVDVAEDDLERALALLSDFSMPSTKSTVTEAKRRHSVGRYVKLALGLSAGVLIFVVTVVGFRGDVHPAMLVISAVGIGAGVASMCALFDL